MKKYIYLLLVILLSVCIAVTVILTRENSAPMEGEITQNHDSTLESPETEEHTEHSVEFTAEYVRTGSYIEDNYYPIVELIPTYEALREYYEANKELYYFAGTDKRYRDSETGFIDACDKSFFEEKALVFVILEEPSGSIRHSVEYVKLTDGIMDIGIDPIVPEAGTDDMAIWHIIVAVDKSDLPASEEDIRIFYDGVEKVREYFDFSIRWNTYGISSYDSRTGLLIKSTDATHPEDYITCCFLPEEQMKNIRNIIEGLDITSYPDEYNPHGVGVSMPYMTLELSVRTESYSKTVTVPQTVLSFETDNAEGQRFLNAFASIIDILTNTDEWRALPDYEFYYD